jgi:hypothetical protein
MGIWLMPKQHLLSESATPAQSGSDGSGLRE